LNRIYLVRKLTKPKWFGAAAVLDASLHRNREETSMRRRPSRTRGPPT